MECDGNAGTNAACRGTTAYTVAMLAESSSNNAGLGLFIVLYGIADALLSSCCDNEGRIAK